MLNKRLEWKHIELESRTIVPTFDILATFIRVAEQSSFTAAADDLKIAKGVISKRIGQLEAELGHALFRRTTRQVHMTPAGEVYLNFARKVMLELEAGSEALSSLRTEPIGLIRLTAPVAWGNTVLAKVIPQFLKLHPKIQVELLLADNMMDLADERIDLALRMTETPLADHVAIPLANLERLLCASKDYIDEYGMPTTLKQLEKHHCLAYWTKHSHQTWHLQKGNELKTVPFTSRYRVNHPNAVKEAILAGLGIGLVPKYICKDELHSGQLVRVLPQWIPQTEFGTKIFAMGLPERIRLSRCQAMLGYLKNALVEEAY